MYNLSDSVSVISGIGKNKEKLLNKKGIFTIEDMLYYLPIHYKNFNDITLIKDLEADNNHIVKLKVAGPTKAYQLNKNLTLYSFLGYDENGSIKVNYFNQEYLSKKNVQGAEIYIYGKVKFDNFGNKYFSAQEFYYSVPKFGILPEYSLTKGLTQGVFRKLITSLLNNTNLEEIYSAQFLEKFNLMNIKEAISNIHYPKDLNAYNMGYKRIVFDELLIFFRMLDFLNNKKTKLSDKKIIYSSDNLNNFMQKIPFKLTDAQLNVMRDISNNLISDQYMNRMVQGDVGSGKTVVAFYAMQLMKEAGYQSALMAPTEVLAQQHFYNASNILGSDNAVLLTGSTKAKEKREIIQKIQNGDAKYIIGTHALLYGDIEYDNLGLLVTDEQHRFGVKQRAVLSKKALDKIHILNLTATPIPRSLALVVYGNTDISIINEMPTGRLPIKTYLINNNKRKLMFDFINTEIKNGRQAYFVCPLIDDENNFIEDVQSAMEMFDEIKKNFSDYRVELLHGKMKSEEKNQIMENLKKGIIDVLVSTTVIEVGVDVPNASVMAIQNAERFGMAQLHQLRGRVGRGGEQSYCFLISDNQSAVDRLRYLTQTTDGFEIAKKDMLMRGTGELWGIRQHGDPMLKIADLFHNYKEVIEARSALNLLKNSKEFYFEYNNINKSALNKIKKLDDEIIMN